MDFKQILEAMGRNIKDGNQNVADAADAMADRAKMQLNPEAQGPKLDQATPAEEDYYKNLVGAVAGSVAPIGKAARLAGPTAKEAASRDIMNLVTEAAQNRTVPDMGMDAVSAAQQAASREADMAARTRAQLMQRKMEALKKIRGE